MATIELRQSDMQRAKSLNRKNGYGLASAQMARLITAYEKGEEYNRALIEFRITVINYHNEVTLLQIGKFDELREQVTGW